MLTHGKALEEARSFELGAGINIHGHKANIVIKFMGR
jgi:hypothetical protein